MKDKNLYRALLASAWKRRFNDFFFVTKDLHSGNNFFGVIST
jgi:hypothetical protein